MGDRLQRKRLFRRHPFLANQNLKTMTTKINAIQSGDYDYPIRVPSDEFESAIFRRLIQAKVKESWHGKQTIDPKTGEVLGSTTGIVFAHDDELKTAWLKTGWFEAYLSIEWLVNADLPLWKKLHNNRDTPVQFCIIEREYPASEALRFEICWRVAIGGKTEQNWLPYHPDLVRKPINCVPE
jgi:hypothetical protein